MAKIGQVTDARKVPTWTRNKKLYEQESEAIMALEIGQAIPIEFDSEEQALSARNTIRDNLNKMMRRAMVLGEPLPMKGMVTTVVERGTGRAWFTMEDANKVLAGEVTMDKTEETPQRESSSKGRSNQRSSGRKK